MTIMIISIVLFLLFLLPSVFLFSFLPAVCDQMLILYDGLTLCCYASSPFNSTPFVILPPVLFGSAIFGTLCDC